MMATAMSFLAGGVGLLIHGASVACIGRMANGRSIVFVHGAAFALGLSGLLACLFLTPAVTRIWLGVSVLLGGAAALFFLNATLAKSVSVRMVRLLAADRDGALRVRDLTSALAGRLIRNRVDVLLGMGLVDRAGKNAYRITEPGRVVARRLDAVRRVFGVQAFILYGDRPGLRRPTDRPADAGRSGPKRPNRAS